MTVEIPVGRSGLVALVDDEDAAMVSVFHWIKKPHRQTIYAHRKINSRPGEPGGWSTQTMHRLLMPDVPMIDHINGNGLDNRRSNLRAATDELNAANQRKTRRLCSSQYKGVSFTDGKWKAHIRVDGYLRHLGTFADEVEAALVYDRAALEAWGDYAKPNFPGVAQVA